MDLMLAKTLALIIAVIAPFLTLFDLWGNTILLLTSIGFAFYDESMYFSVRLLSAMVLIYALGEVWEFVVSLFGIRREKASWFACILVGLGAFAGTIMGTGVFPIFGSILGGIAGAFATAYVYELAHTGIQQNAMHLALVAAKMQFLSMIGKMAAGIAMSVLLIKQVFFM